VSLFGKEPSEHRLPYRGPAGAGVDAAVAYYDFMRR